MEAPVKARGSLYVALEDLRSFKARVDGLLSDLDASDAAPKRIGDQRVTAAQIGKGFGEAGDLVTAYTFVHGRLERLSQTLADQIEAMSLSLHIGHATFENVDLGTQRELLDLNDRIIQAYDPRLDPNAPQNANYTWRPATTAPDAGGGGLG